MTDNLRGKAVSVVAGSLASHRPYSATGTLRLTMPSMFMAGPTQTHRLWLSLVVGVLVLVGSPTAQTPDRHDDGDRTPFLNDYVGQYGLTPTFILNVMRVGDALYVQGPRQSATQMHAQSQTEFVVARSRLRIIFGVNLMSREVDHLIFEQDGEGRRAEKL